MYEERMLGYYPAIIRAIKDFKAIINGEYPEFERLSVEKDNVLKDSYLSTMTENRIKEWEQALGITVLPSSSIEDRRDTIIARIRGQGKLNSELINSIVNAFTGGTSRSWVSNNTLYIEVTPPPTNKEYSFTNLESELKKKVPAHLGLKVFRNYYTWGEVHNNFASWQAVKDSFDTWNDVYLYVPSSST